MIAFVYLLLAEASAREERGANGKSGAIHFELFNLHVPVPSPNIPLLGETPLGRKYRQRLSCTMHPHRNHLLSCVVRSMVNAKDGVGQLSIFQANFEEP